MVLWATTSDSEGTPKTSNQQDDYLDNLAELNAHKEFICGLAQLIHEAAGHSSGEPIDTHMLEEARTIVDGLVDYIRLTPEYIEQSAERAAFEVPNVYVRRD